MDSEQRNKVGYIWDVLFYVILPIVIVIMYIVGNEETSETFASVLDGISWVLLAVEMIGVFLITSRKKNPEYTPIEERKQFEEQVSQELDVMGALISNVIIVLTSVGIASAWYYAYGLLENGAYLVLVIGLVISLLVYNYTGNKLSLSNMKSKTMFWAGFLSLFCSVMVLSSGHVTLLVEKEIGAFIVTIGIIFLFLGIGYFFASYKIKKNSKINY